VGLLDRFMPKYKPTPVPLEGVRGVWTGANTKGGFSLAGGQVIITKDHLAFSPWDMDETRKWLFKLLDLADAPGWVGKIDVLIEKSKLLDPVAIPRAEIVSAQELNRAEALKPPTARITLRDGRSFDVGILASPRSPNVSGANNEAFDHFLRALGEN
jgi:hypothetical protein